MNSTVIKLKILFILWLATIYSCSINGIEPPDIPPVVPIDEAPSWSPDGKWIAYSHFNPDEDDTTYVSGLYVIDTSGQTKRLLISGQAYNPDWSPDGKKISFSAGDIFTINYNGDSLTRLTNVGLSYFPRWSPNGTKISFGRSGNQYTVGIWIIDVNTSSLTRWGYGATPADWSPDGLKIVYEGPPVSVNKGNQIWYAVLNDTTKFWLTSNNYATNRYPSWSPDGSKIAWSATYNGQSDILIMDFDGSNQRKIITGIYSTYPSWSPDSKKIVFQGPINSNNEKGVLWIINIDGTGLKQLTY